MDEINKVTKHYFIELKMPKIDLRELALLRFIQSKRERELAKHFKRSKSAIHELLARIDKNNFVNGNLTREEKEQIKSGSSRHTT